MAKQARIAERLGQEGRATPLPSAQSDDAAIVNGAIAHADTDSHHTIITG
jgi:hypothetical protein